MTEQKEIRLTIDDSTCQAQLFGTFDENIRILEERLEVSIHQRNSELTISGEEKMADAAGLVVEELMQLYRSNETVDRQKLNYIIELGLEGVSYNKTQLSQGILCFSSKGKPIKAKTIGQANYTKAISENDIVFGVGPAGTGKTYLAVTMAAAAYKNKACEKIILTRPAVEAGEKLGFLPGDLQDKVDPYLRPLYDALYDVLGRENVLRLKEKEAIEVIPLAYMRGRTFDRSFIILDEAQNTTKEQMKMFLTRLGFGSKVVVTGDITQTDLPRGKRSGLKEAIRILQGIRGIAFCFLQAKDVVRHELVKRIIAAYERSEQTDEEEEEI